MTGTADLHQALVQELVEVFERSGLRVLGAEGVAGYPPPPALKNDGYGDQEDKVPDVYAYDPSAGQYVIGEAKTGEGDLETEHSLTQYNVFLDQLDSVRGTRSRLVMILPPPAVADFNTLITHYIHPDYWERLALVASSR